MNDRSKNAASIVRNIMNLAPDAIDAEIEKACGDDSQLRNEVEQLLSLGLSPAPDELLEVTSASFPESDELTQSVATDFECHNVGTTIGPYKLLQQIGQGGMGLVFMAEQSEPIRRKVALKVIKPGMDSKAVIARFEAERQALAMMDHQGIARVYDAGMTDQGRPYFVMELVRGKPITQYCDENRLSLNERLELFVLVCQGIQHAHQKGIIHRDIKPSNVLVCNFDGQPVPKIIDFGVAKAIQQSLTEKTMYTQYGQIIGTLEYMSPEQAGISQQDIDTRSDVYSLGVLLYELLTGSTPLTKAKLRSAAYDEMLRLIREEEAQRPSTRLSESGEALPGLASQRRSEPRRLGLLVRGDLDWIVLKALDKDRTRRYETANGLARDIQRHLNNEPVEACPPSAVYKLRKLGSKYRGAISIALSFAVILLVSAIISTWMAIEISVQRDNARDAERVANEARSKATEALDTSERSQAETERALVKAQRDEERANVALGRAEQLAYAGRLAAAQLALVNDKSSWLAELTNCRWDMRGWEFDYLVALSGEGNGRGRWISHGDRVTALAAHPEKEMVAIGGADSLVKLWQIDNDSKPELLHTLEGHEQQVSCLAFTPDGRRLISGSYDGSIKVWDVETGTALARFRASGSQIRCVSVRFDGAQFASGGADAVIRVWDLESGKQLYVLSGHSDVVRSLTFGPSGSQIVSASADKTLRVWDTKTRKSIRTLEGHKDLVSSVAITKDGRRIVSGSWDKTVRLWDLEKGISIQTFGGHTNLVTCVAFAQEDKMILSAGWDRKTRMWSVETGQPVRTLAESVRPISSLATTRGGIVASGSWATSTSLTDLSQMTTRILRGHTREITAVALSPDGQELITGTGDGGLKIWDMKTRKEITTLYGSPKPVFRIAFALNGKDFYTCYADGKALLWDRKTGQAVKEIRAYAISPDGKSTLAITKTSFFRSATLTNIETGEDLQTFDYDPPSIGGVSFSRDGNLLAIASQEGQIRVWDVKTGIEKHRFEHRTGITGIEFHPDSKTLAAVGGGLLRIWDCDKGDLVDTRTSGGISLVFQPSGSRLFVGDADRITVWDSATWRRLLALDGHSSGVMSLAISSDGQQLISGGNDRDVRIWDTDSKFRIQQTTIGGHSSPITTVAQQIDGALMASGSLDGVVKIWSSVTGTEIASVKAHGRPIVGLGFSQDGETLASRDSQGEVKLWQVSDISDGGALASFKVNSKQESNNKAPLTRLLPLALNVNGSQVVFGAPNGGLRIWKKSSKDFQDLKSFPWRATALAFSPDNSLLACGSPDNKVHLLNPKNGETIVELTGHKNPVIGLMFSTDGAKLASVSQGAILKVWNMRSFKEEESRRVSTISNRPMMGIGEKGVGPIAFSGSRIKITKPKKPAKPRPPTLSVVFSPNGYRAVQGLGTLYITKIDQE